MLGGFVKRTRGNDRSHLKFRYTKTRTLLVFFTHIHGGKISKIGAAQFSKSVFKRVDFSRDRTETH